LTILLVSISQISCPLAKRSPSWMAHRASTPSPLKAPLRHFKCPDIAHSLILQHLTDGSFDTFNARDPEFSRAGENGTGVCGGVTRTTGALRKWNAWEAISAATS
jgi:hypothetical protein